MWSHRSPTNCTLPPLYPLSWDLLVEIMVNERVNPPKEIALILKPTTRRHVIIHVPAPSTCKSIFCQYLDAYTLFANFYHPTKTPEPWKDFIDGYRIHIMEPFDSYLRRSRTNAWQGNKETVCHTDHLFRQNVDPDSQ